MARFNISFEDGGDNVSINAEVVSNNEGGLSYITHGHVNMVPVRTNVLIKESAHGVGVLLKSIRQTDGQSAEKADLLPMGQTLFDSHSLVLARVATLMRDVASAPPSIEHL